MINKNFIYLINKIKKKYTFCRFDENINKKKTFYLRFDVDISPNNALKLGVALNKKKIKANFFFQINAETYNCFSGHTIEIVKKLKKMNHCVGLHIDEYLIREKQIKKTINWFSNNVTKIDNVVSFHRPSKKVLGKKYKNFINTYEKKFFNKKIYLSDSRNNRNFNLQLDELIQKQEKKIQLLLHPEWWSVITNEKKIYKEILKRRNDELVEYLSFNFKKVFAKYNIKKIAPNRII